MTKFEDMTFSSELTVNIEREMMDDIVVARAAWVSSGMASQDDAKIEGLINFLMKNRHGTPFEHNSVTFFVKAPIFVWREFMRHRIGISYNEESGRYKQLAPDFYVPDPTRNLQQIGKVGAYDFVPGTPDQISLVEREIQYNSLESYNRYETMLEAGVAKEVARMVLPVNIYSSAYVTMNARSIMNFLSLRTKNELAAYPSFPMWEINSVADQIEKHWSALMPLTSKAYRLNRRVAP